MRLLYVAFQWVFFESEDSFAQPIFSNKQFEASSFDAEDHI